MKMEGQKGEDIRLKSSECPSVTATHGGGGGVRPFS